MAHSLHGCRADFRTDVLKTLIWRSIDLEQKGPHNERIARSTMEAFPVLNPISFSVIKQAVSWANLPTPRLHRVSVTEHDNGTITAIYTACFEITELLDAWVLDDNSFDLELEAWTLRALEQSFCGDIIVASVARLARRGEIVAILNVTLEADERMESEDLSWLID